jgi:hypothetical protein
MVLTDKRRRNTRASTYRPRTEAQKQRRQALWDARADDRLNKTRLTEREALKVRLDELELALRDCGRGGVHSERHTIPLEAIADDDHRFHVLKARVERLEALWSINQRKRETRGKIIIGGAVLAEAGEGFMRADSTLLAQLVDILDRRVERVRDRLTVRELLGDVPLPLRPGGDAGEGLGDALRAAGETLPDFDAMAQSAMADDPEGDPVAGDVDPDSMPLNQVFRAAN